MLNQNKEAQKTSLNRGGVILRRYSEGSNLRPLEWTKRNINYKTNLRFITYNNDLFVTVGDDKIYTSSNGITWTERLHNDDVRAQLQSITYKDKDKQFIAVGRLGKIYTSYDGISWSVSTTNISDSCLDIVYGNGIYVISSIESGTETGNLYISTNDGYNWKIVTSINKYIQKIIYNNGLFVGVGYDGSIISSPDGSVWTNRDYSSRAHFYTITYANGLFVGVGINPTIILTSPDGISWSKQELAYIDQVYAITYGNKLFVGVGLNGNMLTSPDGINWNGITSGPNMILNSITYANGLYVAVGNDGTILTAPDPYL